MDTTFAFLGKITSAFSLIVLPCLADPAFAAAEGRSSSGKTQRADLTTQVAKAGADYQGDGLAVTATDSGARLRCVFQRLDGEATPEGLWLKSTATNQPQDRFRVVATSVGRVTPCAPGATDQAFNNQHSTSNLQLETSGSVSVDGNLVRFARPGLVEEYSVSMDGVRQDFVVLERPPSPLKGERGKAVHESLLHTAARDDDTLRLELAVTGARVEPIVGGAQLVLEKSGRKIAYSQLRVTDATGKELTARMDVAASRQSAAEMNQDGGGLPTRRYACLAVIVEDAQAVYPIRIDPTFSDANWISMGGIAGANNAVNAVAVDGLGNAYIGGSFTMAGDVIANRIAKWDGTKWTTLSSGVNSTVLALAVMGTDLYAGGNFTTAGGIAANRIAKWNGITWSALGAGISGSVFPSVSALAVSGSEVYAGGAFSAAGGIPANFIAKWNGGNWTAVGLGMNSNVAALAVSGSEVYAGGAFTTAGGIPANRIAKWNGTNWAALGAGMNSNVSAVGVLGSEVYAGGAFTTAGSGAANRIAKWNGSTWSVLSSGMNSNVSALAVSGGVLYAGGAFTTAGSSTVNRIAKWNGSSWTALSSGVNNDVRALAVSGNVVYAGGTFSRAGIIANNIAKWSGSSWSSLGLGTIGAVNALAITGTNLFAGGAFLTAGGGAVSGVAKWNGTGWTLLGSGMAGTLTPVMAVAASGTNLYAGGFFTIADGNTVNCIARWNGNRWVSLGSGMNGYVWALAFLGNDLYVGGSFKTAGGIPVNGIAKWDGTSWSALGAGIGDDLECTCQVSALAASGSNLYVGGNFTTAGGISAKSIAKWDGSSWSPLGSGLFIEFPYAPTVEALAVLDGDVFAGGNFTHAGGNAATNLAKWNGSNWSSLGSGISGNPDSRVWALAVSGCNLFAGGYFTKAGGNVVNYAAVWNGSSWSSLGSGMNNYVYAITTSGNDLYVGGAFVAAGDKISAYVARAVLGDAPGYNQLTGTPLSEGAMQFSYVGYPATNYALDRAFDLSPPVGWVGQQTNAMTVSGVLTFTNTPVPGTNNFWRVRAVP